MPLEVEITTEEALPGTLDLRDITLPPPPEDIYEDDAVERSDNITLIPVGQYP